MSVLISDFINKLESYAESDLIYNQFKKEVPRTNLKSYLNFLYEKKAEILLLGEASGYLGCRETGISFSSSSLLLKSKLFLPIRKELLINEIYEEKTASIVFSFFESHPDCFYNTVLFNAFPFHPHHKNNEKSNRKPTKSEIETTIPFLLSLFKIFQFKQYYPIGNVSYELLSKLSKDKLIPSFDFFKIRHPSYGGKSDFLNGLHKLYSIKQKRQTEIFSFFQSE